MSVSVVTALKAETPIVFNVLGHTTFVSFVQSSKSDALITVIPSGIITSVREVQPLKAPLSSCFNEAVSFMLFKEAQPLNASSLMYSTDVLYLKAALKKMCKIVKNSSKEAILNIIRKERPLVKEYVICCFTKRKKRIPTYVADIVTKYLEENVS